MNTRTERPEIPRSPSSVTTPPRAPLPVTALAAVLVAFLVAGGPPSASGVPTAAPSSIESAVPQEMPPRGAYAFVDVAVVPLDEERVLEGHTVLVRDGVIETVAPADEVAIPDDAERIDASGSYLMPGLAEMHGHLPGPDSPEGFTEAVMFLYAANGVTLVRGMQGAPSQLDLQAAVANGETLGPRLYVSSPAISGNRVSDPDQARRLVREYVDTGYDHLKVHEGLTRPVYDAIATTAREHEIRFAGHVSNLVGLRHALDAGQATIDHLDNYIEALVDERELVRETSLFDLGALRPHVDDGAIPDVVEATRSAGTAVVPTMALWETFLGSASGAEIRRRRPEVRYMPPETVDEWERFTDRRNEQLDPEVGAWAIELRRRILEALHDGGVPVLFGTDSPQIFSVPGFSIHHEMQVMVDSGLTPFEVLASGTREVAAYYGTTDTTGTVAAGKRADLILVAENPLDDVGAVSRRVGVMIDGRWLPEERIQARLEEIAAAYGSR